MVTILCTMLAQDGSVTVDNLATTLANTPAESAMMAGMVLGGMPGLVDLAAADTMNAIYTDMSEMVKNLKVNSEIFALLVQSVSDENFAMMESILYSMAPQIDETYDSVLKTLDDAEKASPASINFFAKDFESKDAIEQFIADYNATAEAEGRDSDVLEYSDLVGTLMSSITIIINAISYVLIAFVSVSLVVSSIMIGIITNISVLERTKEIGILRAIGASKKDISRVFNAETMIIGFAAGLLGIIITVVLCWPISAIIQALTGIESLRAFVPPVAAIILVLISVGLTLIAGLIPAKSAAKKDPVIALRTE
jgi:putative ABC transport system permease protein